METSSKLALGDVNSKIDTDEMLLSELKEFFKSEKCCITYPRFFKADLRQRIINLIHKFSNNAAVVKYRVHEYNGLKFLKIYKADCNSFVQESATFKISDDSKKLICKYLYDFSLTLKEHVELCPALQKCNIAKPRIQIYHFSMNKQSNTITIPPKIKSDPIKSEKEHLSINCYRDKILKTVKENQVVIITHDIGIDKLSISQFLLENSSTNNEHCRIVYSNSQKFIAIKNSEIIAMRRGEVMGLTTGYQIPLKSVSSCNKTNLLFTSAAYFLRCLMGVNSKDVFYGITHVILDDVQERNFQTDLLLFEIREVLSFYPNLKILFLCSNPFNIKPLTDYFKRVGNLNLELNSRQQKCVQIYYLNKILKILNYMTPEMEAFINLHYISKTITLDDAESRVTINNLLDRYINECDIEAFDKFCYLVQIEHIPVDVQHSEHLMNMLMGSAKNNRVDNLKTLLKMSANIYLRDKKNKTVYDWAKSTNSMQCLSEIQKVLNSRIADEKFPEDIQRLKAYRFTRTTNFEVDPILVFELLKFLHQSSKIGSILIFTPNYDDILKIQYFLENYFKRNQIENYIIFKLHNNIKSSEIDDMFLTYSTNLKRKFIFSTQIAESFPALNDVLYVVDTGLIQLSNHSIGTSKIQWISKDRAERRKCMIGISEIFEGICFRLYTNQDISNFSQTITPELMHMPLDNVCLLVKVLSPYTTIKDYFMRTICTPSNGQMEKSVHLLKVIGAFEEQESITTLGMRLVDIPLPVQLGKVLIFGIFMQCLDPVLTIISLLQSSDQFFVASQDLYLCKENLAENSNSDHLTFLRIFQKWQDDRLEFIFQPTSQEMFVLDQNLQVVCEIRSEIVGIVRSAQLIHANGILSMNYINSFANNWAMVKACFVAGMYPNICHIEKDHVTSDQSETQFKCNSTECIRNILLFPGSVLRGVAPDSWNKKSATYQTEWVFYQNVVHREKVCRIHNNTLITPITIAIFGGNLKKSEEDLINERNFKDESVQRQQTNKTMLIDDWISFKVPSEDACLIFHLRQKFSLIFLDILENCDNHEKFQRFRRHYIDKLKILETIAKILQNEDLHHNFPKLERIGERPKALPLSCISDSGMQTGKEFNLINFGCGVEISNIESNGFIKDNEDKFVSDGSQIVASIFPTDSSDYCDNNQISQQSIALNNNINMNNNMTETWNIISQSNRSDLNVYQNLIIKNSGTPNGSQIFQHIAFPIETQIQNDPPAVKVNYLQQHGVIGMIPNFYVPNQKQNEIFKYATPNNMKFYILPCFNKNDAIEYLLQNKFHKTCLSLWDEICLKFIDDTNVIHYIFLFDIEESCFCYSGFLIWNKSLDGIRLHAVFKVNFTIDHVIAALQSENRYAPNLVNYIGFGELNFQIGYHLMHCMEIFEKTLQNE